MAEDSNLSFDSNLDSHIGWEFHHNKVFDKLNEVKKSYDFCDIWRVRNTKSKRFSLPQKHSSSLIQRKLDYMFISNSLQEFATMAEILIPISTDHSPVISLSKGKGCLRGKGFWKFNSSLTQDKEPYSSN